MRTTTLAAGLQALINDDEARELWLEQEGLDHDDPDSITSWEAYCEDRAQGYADDAAEERRDRMRLGDDW